MTSCLAKLGLAIAFAASAGSAALACDRALVSVVVPYPAGGSLDGVARIVADAASRATQRSFVVRNVGGGSGTIGVQHVLRQPADGCTVLVGSLNTLMIAPANIASARYTHADLSPIGMLGTTDFVVLASPDLPAQRLEDLPALATRLGTPLRAGHPGTESAQYLALPLIERQLQLTMLPVPYKGSAPMLRDLVGGHIDIAIVASPAATVALEQRHAKLLARLTPWLASEAGGNQAPLETWAGWFVPVHTPAAAQQWLGEALRAALTHTNTQRALQALGSAVPSAAQQEGFAARYDADGQRFSAPAALPPAATDRAVPLPPTSVRDR